MKKAIGVAVMSLALLSACGLDGSQTNEIGLIYSGGLVEDKEYKGLLKPGSTANSVGLGSTVYRYRIDQRSYIANRGRGGDTPPVQVVSEDDVRMTVEYQLYFKLNQSEKILQRFHENLGVKTNAWEEQGWIQMLREYFEPQIERSLEAAALQQNWRDLYASEEARRKFQDETVANLKVAIREVIGADYFCGPSYNGPKSECGDFTLTVGKPEPANQEIVQAIEREQTSVTATIAQEQENLRIAKELEGARREVELYGQGGAVLREAIRSGKVERIIVDGSGRVSIPTN